MIIICLLDILVFLFVGYLYILVELLMNGLERGIKIKFESM